MNNAIDRKSILGMACMREGPDTDRISDFEWCLFDSLQASVGIDYGRGVTLVGHMFHIGGEFDELQDNFSAPARFLNKQQTIDTKTVISKGTWSKLDKEGIKTLLSQAFLAAMK